eukprot:TRINITY_DN3695_c0_g1_i1.p1 TRINITY_DN3695_c0_g1~~TRINITY_DN3695_c0_g1_i1.p1  ORF type:complete len:264 (+),score=37.39 TRINITY_DN3695_c0_g1_i1:56-793(+)
MREMEMRLPCVAIPVETARTFGVAGLDVFFFDVVTLDGAARVAVATAAELRLFDPSGRIYRVVPWKRVSCVVYERKTRRSARRNITLHEGMGRPCVALYADRAGALLIAIKGLAGTATEGKVRYADVRAATTPAQEDRTLDGTGSGLDPERSMEASLASLQRSLSLVKSATAGGESSEDSAVAFSEASESSETCDMPSVCRRVKFTARAPQAKTIPAKRGLELIHVQLEGLRAEVRVCLNIVGAD